jgi:aryl-alcohol dehydrogenase-like predicted oxidoreductase
MEYRILGKTGLSVSLIGLGTWGLGGRYFSYNGTPWGIGNTESQDHLSLLKSCYDCGINFYDTAYYYGNSQEILGKAFSGLRHNVVISANGGFLEDGRRDYSKENMILTVDKSLKKLKRDYIDIFIMSIAHDDIDSLDWHQINDGFNILKKSGKIRSFGYTLQNVFDALKIIEVQPMDVLHFFYNLYDARASQQLFPIAREKNIGIIIKSPLNKGVLTGKYTNDKKFDIFDNRSLFLDRITLEKRNAWIDSFCMNFSINRLDMLKCAILFIISNPYVSTTIPGMRSNKQFLEIISVLKEERFSAEVLKQFEQFSLENMIHLDSYFQNPK